MVLLRRRLSQGERSRLIVIVAQNMVRHIICHARQQVIPAIFLQIAKADRFGRENLDVHFVV